MLFAQKGFLEEGLSFEASQLVLGSVLPELFLKRGQGGMGGAGVSGSEGVAFLWLHTLVQGYLHGAYGGWEPWPLGCQARAGAPVVPS